MFIGNKHPCFYADKYGPRLVVEQFLITTADFPLSIKVAVLVMSYRSVVNYDVLRQRPPCYLSDHYPSLTVWCLVVHYRYWLFKAVYLLECCVQTIMISIMVTIVTVKLRLQATVTEILYHLYCIVLGVH